MRSGRRSIGDALHAAAHAAQTVVVETAGLVACVGLARQLAQGVVSVAPVAEVGVAHACFAAGEIMVDVAAALPAAQNVCMAPQKPRLAGIVKPPRKDLPSEYVQVSVWV